MSFFILEKNIALRSWKLVPCAYYTKGKELPNRAYEEAAALAAYYSKGREQEKVEVDYARGIRCSAEVRRKARYSGI